MGNHLFVCLRNHILFVCFSVETDHDSNSYASWKIRVKFILIMVIFTRGGNSRVFEKQQNQKNKTKPRKTFRNKSFHSLDFYYHRVDNKR